MNTSRETVYAALFALVSGAAPFITKAGARKSSR